MAPHVNSRRRQRAEESDEDRDGSPKSVASSAKRARTNGYDSNQQSSTPRYSQINGGRTAHAENDEDEDEDEDEESDNTSPSVFQPGAIVRVRLVNFVTYELAEFFPGPNLNMVIGPNGTGKSSLVCAICLGLGWSPKVLGRADDVADFVRHGYPQAETEVELYKRSENSQNITVRSRINRDDKSREWWINNKKAGILAVRKLMTELSIQIDNLCQFLPQDKVSGFAMMSPVELLHETQRAAAQPEMLVWHENLKNARKEQKAIESHLGSDKEALENMEARQQNLHAEVQRLQERNQIVKRIDHLEKTIPFVEYQSAVNQHREFTARKKDAQRRLKRLEKEIQPTMELINKKQQYSDQISHVVNERASALDLAERDADRHVKEIESFDASIKTLEQEADLEKQADVERKKEMQKQARKITDLKAQDNADPVVFDSAEWNERVRVVEREIREKRAQLAELAHINEEKTATGRSLRASIDEADRELAALSTQEGQQMNKLEQESKQVANAWKWVQEHQDEFEDVVYGPAIVTCSVKDPRYTDQVESLMSKNDFLAITTQNGRDFNKLSNHLHKNMGLTDVTLRSSEEPIPTTGRVSAQEMHEFGLDGFALDMLDGPDPVLAMLSQSAKLYTSAVSLRETNEAQYSMIEQSNLTKWVTKSSNYQITRRMEYGPGAVSTTTRTVRPAQRWTDQPIDSSAKEAIQMRIDSLATEFNVLKADIKPIRDAKSKLERAITELEPKVGIIKKEKAILQKAYSERQALPDKIRHEVESLEERKKLFGTTRDRLKKIYNQQDLETIRKAKVVVAYKDRVARIRACHAELLEAKIRYIEAESDVAGLKERNGEIVVQLAEERAEVEKVEEEANRVHAIAKKALDVIKQLQEDLENAEYREGWTLISRDLTIESLEQDIATEKSKLQFMHLNNPNAIRDYEKRQEEVDKLKRKIAVAEADLEAIQERVVEDRRKWEPELDKLIAEISDAFSYNFEQIGCAGEVGVHKDEDFSQWAIQIKVKFRENETLQILDAHRQSGGERSVSTIFYLMALQSMARSPFRVVDEINQGMDPRNERMVHERMVEIACKEHTSQYFLITPKLLTGLRYDKRMKVLCIASGEHMPSDSYKKMDIGSIIQIKNRIAAAAAAAAA